MINKEKYKTIHFALFNQLYTTISGTIVIILYKGLRCQGSEVKCLFNPLIASGR